MATVSGDVPAPPGCAFAPRVFDDQVGKIVRVSFGGGFGEEGVLVAAQVAEGGRSARLTLEIGTRSPSA